MTPFAFSGMSRLNTGMFARVSILAPGLLGGSLGLALHRRSLAGEVVVWARRPEVRLECLDSEWCTRAPDTPEEAVAGADLVVLCPPVDVIVPLLRRVLPHLYKDALVTDVGSTKSLIVRECTALVRGRGRFIGSHPMAGSEKSGLRHARADLFEGRPCLVTPLEETPEPDTRQIAELWRALGMDVRTLGPEQHDEIVAHLSHLPHLLASALSSFLAGKEPQWRHYAGQGLCDTTRVAAGDPNLWRAIVEQNREEILRALGSFEDELARLRTAIANAEAFELLELLEAGKRFRDRLGGRSSGSAAPPAPETPDDPSIGPDTSSGSSHSPAPGTPKGSSGESPSSGQLPDPEELK